MQRKQLLKGKVYRAGQSLVRVLDTDTSPVPTETYDLIQQTWVRTKTHPRDIDAVFSSSSAAVGALLDYSNAMNAAWKRRIVLATIDAVNEKFNVSIEPHAESSTYGLLLTVETENSKRVTVSAADFAQLTVQRVAAPAVGTMHIPADHFVRWAFGPLGIQAPKVADIQPLPGLDPAHLDADLLRKAQKIVDEKIKAYNRAHEIEGEVRDAAAEAEKKRRVAAGEDARRFYVSSFSSEIKDNPDVIAEVAKRLADAGLTLDDANASAHKIRALSLKELGLV